MQTKIWYGVDNGNVLFSKNQSALTDCDNVNSFTVSDTGEITGLDFEESEDIQTSSPGSHAA